MADFVEQRVFLSINVAAGLIVSAPSFLALRFERSRSALPFQFLRQCRRETSGLLRLFECIVQFVQLGFQGSASVFSPSVKLFDLSFKPAAIAIGRLVQESLPTFRLGGSQNRRWSRQEYHRRNLTIAGRSKRRRHCASSRESPLSVRAENAITSSVSSAVTVNCVQVSHPFLPTRDSKTAIFLPLPLY